MFVYENTDQLQKSSISTSKYLRLFAAKLGARSAMAARRRCVSAREEALALL